MSPLLSDIVYSLRRLAKSPGFATMAVLTLAISLGATVAVYGIVNELLFKPRAVSRPDELGAVGFQSDRGSLTMMNISRPFYELFRAEQRSFSDLIGFAHVRLKMTRQEDAEWVPGELVSGSYFQTLGVKPALGRPILPSDDDQPGLGTVAVISHAFWQRHFQGDPSAVGQTLRLEDQLVEVVGVAPQDYTGLDAWATDLWMPTTLESIFQKHTVYRLVGRPGPDVTWAQAQADLRRVSRIVSETYGRSTPSGYEQYGMWTEDNQVVLLSAGRGSVSPFYNKEIIWRAFFLFMGASGLMLLIGCSNFANLLLVRSFKHRKETATKLALGARRRQIVRGSVVESLLLAGLGGFFAVVLALGLNHLLVIWKPSNVRFMAEVTLDGRMLAFSALVALGTGLCCGLIPAFLSLRFDLFAALKSETVLEGEGRRRVQCKHWLVASQIALCLALLMGAGLCLRSFSKLLGLDPGFDTQNTMVATINFEQTGYAPEESLAALTAIMQRLRALPGINRVTFSWDHPLNRSQATYEVSELSGYEAHPDEKIEFNVAQVGPDFFRSLGAPLKQGRELSHRDVGSDQQKILVNESFVRRYWPDQTVLGKHVFNREVIGVVQDARIFDLTEEPLPLVFRQAASLRGQYTHLLIRTEDKAEVVLPSITMTLRSINPKLSLVVPRTMRTIVLNSLGPQRYTLTLIAGFALLALILAAIGIYGLMAYMVSLMTKEVGIRLSLGAQRQDIIHLVLHFGLKIITLGILLGVPCAIFATRFLRAELYEVEPLNPLVFTMVLVLLTVVSMLACYLPARRAATVDPMEVLRNE